MSIMNPVLTSPIRVLRFVWLLTGLWTVAVGVTLTWELLDEVYSAQDVARAEARGAWRNDYSLLRWYSAAGGLYAPSGGESPSSTEGVSTTDGLRMKLVYPTDMINRIQYFTEDRSGVRSHLTRAEPRLRENTPDAWESQSLAAFANDREELSSVEPLNGQPYMRLMRPLVLKQDCARCHAQEKAGEVFGGISASVPMSWTWPNERDEMLRRVTGYGGMWLLGLFGIALAGRNLRGQVDKRLSAEQTLRLAESQMAAARRIQEHLLPEGPPSLPGYDIAGASHPAEYTSGDYFDYIPMIDGAWGIVVADVCGHGIGPALLMASTQATLRTLMQTHVELSEIMALANRFLSDASEQDRYVTLFLARLDSLSGVFSYSSAGHPNTYVLNRSGEVKACLSSTSLPLAIDSNAEFPVGNSVMLERGDAVVLVTDGILESLSPQGEAFSTERVLQVVRESISLSSAEIIKKLFAAARAFSQRKDLVDDITAIVIKVE
jgi:serine phosphatase RsbU (regulator of sigma subunit)